MSSDHILEWRDYLTGQFRERHGLAEKEAQKMADRWLRSKVGGPSNQRLRTQPAASRARAASQGS
jgi:hypothetical protein